MRGISCIKWREFDDTRRPDGGVVRINWVAVRSVEVPDAPILASGTLRASANTVSAQ